MKKTACKLIIGFVLGCIVNVSIAQPSPIDVVRASNAYSQAKAQYTSGNHQTAWTNLATSRKNLKGKTNRDLEFLEIMVQYHLGRYSESYSQLVAYFEAPSWADNAQSFRNVETLDDDDIDYEAELTVVFDELEKWANLQDNANPGDAGSQFGARLANDYVEFVQNKIREFNPDFTWRHQSGNWNIRYYANKDSDASVCKQENNLLVLRASYNWSDKGYDFYWKDKLIITFNIQLNLSSSRVSVSSSFEEWNGNLNDYVEYFMENIMKSIVDGLDYSVNFSEDQQIVYGKDGTSFKRALTDSFWSSIPGC